MITEKPCMMFLCILFVCNDLGACCWWPGLGQFIDYSGGPNSIHFQNLVD